MGNPSARGVDPSSAVAPAALNVAESDHPAAEVADLVDLPSQLRPALLNGGAVLRGSVRSAERDSLERRPHRHDLGVLIE